jgi:hypothetical protein
MAMFHEWIEGRVALAERLASGQCGGSSAEAILILSSLISGIAADLWPGKGIDRHRFVELWARYSHPELTANLISTPLLIHDLDTKKSHALSDRIRAIYAEMFSPRGLPDTRVVTGEDVDVFDDELQRILPEMQLPEIRQWSYPNVFYVHFRSSYVHEYQVGTHADAIVMSDTRSFITYGNFLPAPHRRINFDVGWLASVARSIVGRAEAEWNRRPIDLPARWWLDGAA